MSREARPGAGWIAVTVRVPARQEEAVVTAFAFEGCLGVETRSTALRRDDPRATIVVWFSGRRALRTVTRLAASRLAAAGVSSAVRARVSRVADGRWVESWQKSLRPMPIGRRILALPEGCAPPPSTRRIVIHVPFGQAFGTGEHASTRLSLRLMERHLNPGDRVVDLGTVTAILSVAAARFGAGPILAVDNDPVALRVARDTLSRNGLAGRIELRRDDASAGLPERQFDMALVNIGATVIERLLPGLATALAPGGCAVLAGILIDDESRLGARARELGFVVVDRLRQRPWAALLVRRPRP
jgi:ribosomal protein L11 methyltransferase